MSEYLGFQPVSEEYINSGKEFYFISYNSQDINYITPIVLKLHEMGVPLWYDYGIPYNSKWTGVIVDKIKKCRAVLFFLTWGIVTKVGPNGDDPYTMKEYKIAKAAKKEIFVNAIDQINLIDEFGKIPDDKVEFILDIEDRQSIPIFKNPEDLDWISSEICRAIKFVSAEPVFIPQEDDQVFNELKESWNAQQPLQTKVLCSDGDDINIESKISDIFSSFQIENGILKKFTGTEKEILIPNVVVEIGNSAFSECSDLISVVIPNSVKNIGESAFRCCFNLTNIVIPNSVINIGMFAFSYCRNLTNIKIENSAINIAENAFNGCWNLKSIAYTGTRRQWDNLKIQLSSNTKICCTKKDIILEETSPFQIKNGILQKFVGTETKVVIPDNVTAIGDWAFSNCANLKSVIIPKSVTHIGKSAFNFCENLNSIEIKSNTMNIEEFAFSRCFHLKDVIIPNGVSSIGNSAFSGCEDLLEIVIPNSVKEIGNSAFLACRSLTNISIPNSITHIEESTFAFCKNLTSVRISGSVATIEKNAFDHCENLKAVFYAGTKKQWNQLKFSRCFKKNVKIHFVF